MAQSGFTPIQLYSSTVTGHAPTSAELANGEMAINTVDGIMFYKNASGNIAQFASAAGLVWQTVQTANFTAETGFVYPINTTSGAITVTLPATPGVGSSVCFVDYAGTFATHNVTVSPNGNKIQGYVDPSTLNVNRSAVTMVYANSTEGWVAYSSFNNPNVTPSYSISYLVVAGGGGAGSASSYGYRGGGGGGGGGALTNTYSLTSGIVYTVTIGAGGTVATIGNTSQVVGIASTTGGGYGGGDQNSGTGGTGGSGGGGQGASGGGGGSGTAGQGFAGGSAAGSGCGGGGGGGAGAVGAASGSASGGNAGNGGTGLTSSITGTANTYAGGGGGGTANVGGVNPGTGGSGGGGSGGSRGAQNTPGCGASAATSGSANTGGGGGGDTALVYNGGATQTSFGAGSGGSGVVILSIPTTSYSGVTTGSPTVTTSGSNTILTYTSSGSYTA